MVGDSDKGITVTIVGFEDVIESFGELIGELLKGSLDLSILD